jgi:hypothetical protein
MNLLAFLVVIGAIPFAVGTAALRQWRHVPEDARPSAGWRSALVVLLVIDTLLALAFLWAMAVFNCHGGYECPV